MNRKAKGSFGCAPAEKKSRGPAVRLDQPQGGRDPIEVDKAERRLAKRRANTDVLIFAVAIPKLKSSEIRRNIKAGQAALARALPRIIKPGIKLDVVKGVPLFHADPLNPKLLIRDLNGKRERGMFLKGKFKIIE